MGFTGMVSFSIDLKSTRPDLGFFTLLLKEQTELLSLLIITTWISFDYFYCRHFSKCNFKPNCFVDGKATFNLSKKTNYLSLSKYLIIIFIFNFFYYCI